MSRRQNTIETLWSERNASLAPSNNSERARLFAKFKDSIHTNPDLTRSLVSFQANKTAPFYRWMKYKEAFSSDLVKYIIQTVGKDCPDPKSVLDPFAGVGTTLTTSAKQGWRAAGIELLPVGVAAIKARLAADRVSVDSFIEAIEKYKSLLSRTPMPSNYSFPHIKITEKAFSSETEREIAGFLQFQKHVGDKDVSYLLWFACLSVLEEVSFTRKDGQYLRWDSRSGRALRSKFNKGKISGFREAILGKLDIMLEDIRQRNGGEIHSKVDIIAGSCLDELPRLPDNSISLIITSPPYCNRYDYTRTYALELAFMGYSDGAVKALRQKLLSATVENRSKRAELRKMYQERGKESEYYKASDAYENQAALQEVLEMLQRAKSEGRLNNNNIVNMVANYFFEMNLVIHELARILKPGGRFVMVNDNVRYVGEEAPVDLILSDMAEHAGLDVSEIWALPRGKGNSSQQMGDFGRTEMRKCVYVWEKPE